MLNDSKKLKLSAQYRFQWEEAQNCYVLLYPEGLIKLGQSSAEILKQFLVSLLKLSFDFVTHFSALGTNLEKRVKTTRFFRLCTTRSYTPHCPSIPMLLFWRF